MTLYLALLVFFSLPGVVVLLVVTAIWRRRAASPGLEELDALFQATKRHELDERKTALMLRDEEGDGAPHRKIDLDGGKAAIKAHGSPRDGIG